MDEIFKEKKAASYLESSDQTSKDTEKKPESARPELDGIPAASGAERHATVDELLSRNAALEQKLTEQRNIAACLETMAWAGERLVLDGGSSDETRAICESIDGVRLEQRPFDTFPAQRNAALRQQHGELARRLPLRLRVRGSRGRRRGACRGACRRS